MNVRETALALLLLHEGSDTYINLALSSHKADGLTPEERGILTVLLYTVTEKRITYDYYIGALAKRSPDDIHPRTRSILRLGLCQIVDMEKIPDFAAVNETVKLAKNKGERAFVNGVLRAAVREKDSLPMPDKKKNAARYYSVKYSLPLGIVKHFLSSLGEEESVKLFCAFNSHSPTDLTVNTLKVSVGEYLDMLKEKGYNATRVDLSEITVRIYGSVNPRNLPGYDEGLFFVQDAACAICASALGAMAGERIADVCSAPGGKSFAIGILTSDRADVRSFDLHESKLSLIESGSARLGLRSVSVAQRDATSPDASLFGSFDRVLCDVPCSGLGVIAKKPDLRYGSLDAMTALPPLQLEILRASAGYLKPGGTLVYSTCTLNKAENEDVVSAFLAENTDFTPEDFTAGSISSEGGMLTTYPHIHNTDGFFICKLRKNK